MATRDGSYRDLLAVPGLARILVALYAGRIAAGMLEVGLVLFALLEFDSPAVAGVAAFLSTFPGLLAAPVIGALLDRFGRVRLVCLDYLTMGSALVVISVLSWRSVLPAGLFLTIVFLFGVTYQFGEAGMRSLLPEVSPDHLWERVNAIDSSSYNIAWILGPPVAAGLVGTLGGEVAFLVVATLCAGAWVCLSGVREPPRQRGDERGLAAEALDGLRYVWRNPTLRGLGISVSITNIGFGMTVILVPVIIVEQLGGAEVLVGLAFTASGVAGVLGALVVGRMDTRGREWSLLVLAMAGIASAVSLLLPGARSHSVAIGVMWVVVSMTALGVAGGVWDIALFTMRQRRTDPRLLARAISISMAFNWSGFPIGAALGGYLADESLGAAIAIAVGAAALGTALGAALVPRFDTFEQPTQRQVRPQSER